MAKKKRLNRRLVILLSVVLLVGLAFGGVGWLVSRPKDPKHYREQAEKALEQNPKQYERAQQMFGRAIAESKDDRAQRNEYRYDYAMMLFDRRMNDPELTTEKRVQVYWDAIGILKSTLEDDPTYMKARRKLADEYWGRAYAMQRDSNPHRILGWKDLVEHLDIILENQQDPEMYYRRAIARRFLAEEGEADEQLALKDYRQAIATSSPGDQNVGFRAGLCEYLYSSGQTEQAEKEYKEAITANPKNANAYIGYAGFLLREKRKEEAVKQIQAAMDNDPENEKGYIYMSQLYASDKDTEKALEVLKNAPKDRFAGISIYSMEGQLYAQMGQLQNAIDAYVAGLDAIDKQVVEGKKPGMAKNLERTRAYLVTRIANMYLGLYEKAKGTPEAKAAMDQVEKYNELLVKLVPGTVEQLELAGRIAYAKDDLNQARKSLEQARTLRNEITVRRQGKQVAADPEITRLLWIIYERTKSPSKAKQELKSLRDILRRRGQVKPTYEVMWANYELRDKNYKAARAVATKVLDDDPDNESAKRILRNLDIVENRKLPSDDTELDASAREAMLRLAGDYMTDGQNDKAIEVMQKLLKSDPNDKRVLVSLIRLLMESDQKDAALEVVSQAVKNSPEDKDLAKWKTILQVDDPEKAFDVQMKSLDEIEDLVERNLGKWRLCMGQKKTEEADKYLKQAEKAGPSDPRVIKILYAVAVQNKDWDAAQKAIDRLPEESTFQRELYKGQLFAAQKKYDEAIAIFEKVLQDKPNLGQVRLVLMNCYLGKQDYDNAEKQMLIMVENDSSNIGALVGLAKLAQQRKNPEDFEKWVRAAYKHNKGKRHPFIRDAFLTLETEKNDPQKAIVEREKNFQKDPTNFQNALRLAALYEDQKQIDKAQEKYEYIMGRVSEKIRFSPVVAKFYLRIGRQTKGYKLFDSLLATAKTPAEKASVYVNYGNFLTQIGEIPSAEGMYKKAIESDPKNPKGYRGLSDCYAMLASRLDQMGQKDQAEKAWGDSIEQLKKLQELEPNDIQVQRILCYRQASAGKYQEAIDGFRNMLKSNPDDKSARLGIARMYQSQNEPQKCLAEVDGILKDYPQYAEAYVARAQVYTQLREFKKADVAYRDALNIDNNLNWMLFRAQLNTMMGDSDRALTIYSDAINGFPDNPRAYIGQMDLLKARGEWGQVKLLAETGMSNPAFEKVPNFAVSLAEVYKLQKQPRQELAMLSKAMEIAPNNTQIIRNYLKSLALNQQFSALESEAKKYINDPRQKPGVMGILAFANAMQNPNTPEAMTRFYAALKESRPGDISYVLNLMQQATGPQGLTANAAELQKIHPGSDEIPFAIGRAWMGQKKYPEAVAEYQKALGLAKAPGQKVTTLLALAAAYTVMKQDENTEKAYRKVLEIDPNNKAALNNLAYLLADSLNRPKEALPLSEKAMKLEPGSTNVVDTYAWILAELNEYKKAMTAYDEIKDRKLKNPEILYHIAFVAEKLEKYEMAKEFYQQALAGIKVFKNHPLKESIPQGLERVKQKLEE